MEKEFYTCKEVAEKYGLCKASVWALVRSGKLEAVKIGRIYRISKKHLEEFEKNGL